MPFSRQPSRIRPPPVSRLRRQVIVIGTDFCSVLIVRVIVTMVPEVRLLESVTVTAVVVSVALSVPLLTEKLAAPEGDTVSCHG